MKKGNSFLYSLAVSPLVLISSCHINVEKKEVKPNVLVFVVDDMGWKDVGCFGSDFYQTPNIDQLAAQGIRFTNSYSSCTVCSPTRASIMTGKNPATINCTDWIEGWKFPFAKLNVPDWTMYMKHSEYTIAEAFKNAGYKTAHFGKWHLGEEEEYWPENHGFDINKGGWRKGAPNKDKKLGSKGYFSPYGNPRLTDGEEGEYLTERLANEVCHFIDDNKDQPFFANFWFYNVHTPLQAKKEKVKKYAQLVDSTLNQKNPVYAAMVEHVDEAVGKVMNQLKAAGLLENTIVLFTSDNGGLIGNAANMKTNNAPLRSGKGDIYEGGVRIPTILSVPGLKKQGVVVDEPVISSDYYPTLIDLAGIQVPQNVMDGFDGVSWNNMIKGSKSMVSRSLFWHYPHYHMEGARPYSAVREGDWKLIHLLENDTYELYNLKEDIGEQNNLLEQNPAKAELLKGILQEWRMKTKAQMPSPNPNYNPEKWNKRE